MNEDEMRIEETELLSPEEEAAIDRLLKETAELENGDVDYGHIKDRILFAAKRRGIEVIAKKKKSSVIKRLIPGIAAAAAVFVVGLAVLSIVNSVFTNKNSASGNDKVAYNDSRTKSPTVTAEAVKNTEAVVLPTENVDIVPETSAPDVTNDMTASPVVTALPTEYPVRGGTAGYTVLTSFVSDPVDSEELLPDGYADRFKKVSFEDDALSASASGEDEDGIIFYSCRVTEIDESLSVGVARYTVNEIGLLRYVWRVTQDCCLDIIIEGFDRPDAEELLLTLALCDDNYSTLLDAA